VTRKIRNGDLPLVVDRDRTRQLEVVKRNWRAEVETAQRIVIWPNASGTRDAKAFFLRMAEAEERCTPVEQNRDLGAEPPVLKNTQAGGSAAGGTKLREPKSPFAGWKRRKNGRKPNFMIKLSVPWPPKKMCRNFCGKAQSRKKRMRERLAPWRRRLARAPRWTKS
jgi:hypothetical protein